MKSSSAGENNPAAPIMPPGKPAIENVVPPVPAGNRPMTPSEPSKSPFWKSKWVLILVIVLVILIPLSVFAAVKITSKPTPSPTPLPTVTPSPTPVDETVNWKTYTATQSAILLKYPQDWNIMDLPDPSMPDSICGYMFLGKADISNDPQIIFCYISQKLSDVYPEVLKGNDYNQTVINGYQVYERTTPITNPLIQSDTYILDSDGTFAVFSKYSIKNDKLYNQILSTFKFTENASPSAGASASASPAT